MTRDGTGLPYVYKATVTLGTDASGVYGLSIIATDDAGNVANATGGTITYDLDDPAVVPGSVGVQLAPAASNPLTSVTSVTSGSSPWGYGSFFGISGGVVRKMNGIRIGSPAKNTRLIGAQVHMRAMGHAIFVQGAVDTLIEDCHVDGLKKGAFS